MKGDQRKDRCKAWLKAWPKRTRQARTPLSAPGGTRCHGKEYLNEIMRFIDPFPLRTQRDMRKMSLTKLEQMWLMTRCETRFRASHLAPARATNDHGARGGGPFSLD
jgi:hypothetical protein